VKFKIAQNVLVLTNVLLQNYN